MARFLLFRRKLRGADDFVVTVRNLVRRFDGTPADRNDIVNQVIRRCDQPDICSNGPVIAELERILDGFLEPWYDEVHPEWGDSPESEGRGQGGQERRAGEAQGPSGLVARTTDSAPR